MRELLEKDDMVMESRNKTVKELREEHDQCHVIHPASPKTAI